LTSAFVWMVVYWLACVVLIGLAYRFGWRALGVLGTVARGDRVLLAEVLVLRQENPVLRRRIARVRYEPADRAWFAALSALIPRARWAEVFPRYAGNSAGLASRPGRTQMHPGPPSSGKAFDHALGLNR
jgi:hypothetical protein